MILKIWELHFSFQSSNEPLLKGIENSWINTVGQLLQWKFEPIKSKPTSHNIQKYVQIITINLLYQLSTLGDNGLTSVVGSI